jgi:hypothetical protein
VKPFIDLYEFYLNDVPGCSYKLAADAVRMAAQVFFERTRAWRVSLAPVVTVNGQSDYAFPLSLNVELVWVHGAKVDGRDIPLLRETPTGARGIVIHGLREFTLYPVPADGEQIVFDVALEPSNEATGLDDVMYAKYAKVIAKQAKAQLLSMDNQPFSNPARALALRAEFDADVDRTISDVNARYNAAPRRTKAHLF